MNSKIYLSIFFSISFFFSIAQTTINSGNWEVDTTWNGNSPGLSLTMNATIDSDHGVFLGTEEINKTLLLGTDNIILTIKGRLKIHGSLTVSGKKIDIIVADGGELIITENVNFTQQQGGTNMPDLNISGAGTVNVNGNVTSTGGGGNITGTGTITVDGEVTGVEVDTTVTYVGNPAQYCHPEHLKGTVASQGSGYNVTLEWVISAECVPTEFKIKRTLGETVEEFTKGNTKSTPYSWIDPIELSGTSEPIYEVRAVYALANGNVVTSEATTLNYTNNPLPIELLHFTASSSNNEVVINWATAAEINNDFFTIEKSRDGSSWEVVDYITGAGNSNYMIEYSYTDANASEGISYYRLKQTDYDGQFEYFAPAAVSITKAQAAAEIVSVNISATSMDVYFQNESENAVIMVADIQGRILAQYNLGSEEYVQNVKVNFPRSYAGEVVMVRMVSSDSSVEKKFMVR